MSLPAVLANVAGRDSWLSMALLFGADVICLFFLLWAVMLNKQGTSFREILNAAVSPVIAKVFYVILAAFFALRLISLLGITIDLFSTTFTIKTNWLAYAIPLSLALIYVTSKGLTTVARIAELLFLFIMLSLAAMLLLAATKAEFTNILPFLSNGMDPVITASLNYSFWYSDALFILFAFDSFKPNKKVFLTIPVCFIIGALLTVGTDILFLSLFDELAPFSTNAMSKVSQFSIDLSTSGRLDWLTLSIWLMSLFIKASLMTFCLYRSMTAIFGASELKFNYWLTGLAFVPIIILPMLITANDLLLKYICNDIGKYFLWVVQYFLPLAMPLFTFIGNKKLDKKANSALSDAITEDKTQLADKEKLPSDNLNSTQNSTTVDTDENEKPARINQNSDNITEVGRSFQEPNLADSVVSSAVCGANSAVGAQNLRFGEGATIAEVVVDKEAQL